MEDGIEGFEKEMRHSRSEVVGRSSGNARDPCCRRVISAWTSEINALQG